MIPIGDDNSDRQRWPVVTAVLVAANVLAFFYELSVGQAADGNSRLAEFVTRWGVVPLEYSMRTDLPPMIDAPFFVTMLTSMFLHGGWGHLLGNMLFLWVFGDNVEDRMGRVAFVFFYLVAGFAGAAAQILVDPQANVPMIGASGAISGVLGAYLVKFPTNRVNVLVFYFVVAVPAFVVIGLWALIQGFSQYGAVISDRAGGVAYMAHIGGFAAGVLAGLYWKIFVPAPDRA